jgi:hypothetical protein
MEEEVLDCEFCNSLLHITTECPTTTPDLVYDQAETPPRPRRPGERVDSPALWPSLYQATLHYLVTNVIQYFQVLHNSQEQRQSLLRFIWELLDLSPSPPVSDLTVLQEDAFLTTLFDQAVTTLIEHLLSPPFPLRNIQDPLLHTLCKRYYSPIFGRLLDEYRQEVYTSQQPAPTWFSLRILMCTTMYRKTLVTQADGIPSFDTAVPTLRLAC